MEEKKSQSNLKLILTELEIDRWNILRMRCQNICAPKKVVKIEGKVTSRRFPRLWPLAKLSRDPVV